jgi:hypothetical protein
MSSPRREHSSKESIYCSANLSQEERVKNIVVMLFATAVLCLSLPFAASADWDHHHHHHHHMHMMMHHDHH